MSRRRGLTPEEEALWRKVTRDVAPSRMKKPVPEMLVSPPKSMQKPSSGMGLARRHMGPEGGPAGPASHGRPKPPSPRLEHPFASGDPRLEKLAGRGRLPIDATLDLHGHTQRTARPVLHQFIAEGYARGARCLLVITGKGAPEFTRGVEAETGGAWNGGHSGGMGGGMSGGSGRGVLRARLAHWIGEDTVRKFVSRASPAHQRHGGGGAFYIFLKR